jgi:hypothetical protein
MSATFPYISPAVVLLTALRRRVVDAGYFDNHGVDLAADWLKPTWDDPAGAGAWLDTKATGVLLIQSRDGVGVLAHDQDQ